MSNKKDALGDRMKTYEYASTMPRAFKGQPIIARIDGRAFHTFCKNMDKPFDRNFNLAMTDVMKYLVKEFNAVIGYRQSDEINLVWYLPTDSKQEYLFDGRFQKYNSILASEATLHFQKMLNIYEMKTPKNAKAVFDCRTFVVPNKQEAFNLLVWRQEDATKNAIQMVARSLYAHKELIGKSNSELQELIFVKGKNFNNYDPIYKRGVFARVVEVEKELGIDRWKLIPEKYRPNGPVKRNVVQYLDIWLTKLENPMETIFLGESPEYSNETKLKTTFGAINTD